MSTADVPILFLTDDMSEYERRGLDRLLDAIDAAPPARLAKLYDVALDPGCTLSAMCPHDLPEIRAGEMMADLDDLGDALAARERPAKYEME